MDMLSRLSSSRPLKIFSCPSYFLFSLSSSAKYSSVFSDETIPHSSKGKPVWTWDEKPRDEKPWEMALSAISSGVFFPSQKSVWVWRFCFIF